MALLLSLNLMILLGLDVFCVAISISNSDWSSGLSSTMSLPLKNQWRLCSLLLCARSKHSTLVGFLCSWIEQISYVNPGILIAIAIYLMELYISTNWLAWQFCLRENSLVLQMWHLICYSDYRQICTFVKRFHASDIRNHHYKLNVLDWNGLFKISYHQNTMSQYFSIPNNFINR